MGVDRFSLTTVLTGRTERAENRGSWCRQVVALWVAMAVLSVPIVVFASPSNMAKASTGLIIVDGEVTLNGARVISGQTLFSGSTIATDKQSHSVVELNNSARLKLGTQTSLSVTSSDSRVSASLTDGTLDLLSPAGVRVEVVTADSTIVADLGQQTNFRIQVEECGTTLSMVTGQVEIRSGNKAGFVSAGESFSTAGAAAPVPASKRKKAAIIIPIVGGVAAFITWLIIHNRCTPVTSPTGTTGQCV